MPITKCKCCPHDIEWSWEEAFDKFGFMDGDGTVMTSEVAVALHEAGYEVDHDYWGAHNDVIHYIRKDGVDLIPEDANVGYDDPWDYLPAEVIKVLEDAFGE